MNADISFHSHHKETPHLTSMTSLASQLSSTSMTSQGRYGRKAQPPRRPMTAGLADRAPASYHESFTETVGVITGKGLQTHSGSFGGKVGARPRTAGHKSGPSVYRPIRPATAGPRTHGASSRVPKKRGTRAKPNKGVLSITLEVNHLEMEKADDESWLRGYQRKILRLYTVVIRDQQVILKRLNDRCTDLDLDDVTFTKISLGSIIVHAQIKHARGLDLFQDFLDRGELTLLVNDVIVTRDLLEELGVSELGLTAHVRDDAVSRCRKEVQEISRNRTLQQTGHEENGAVHVRNKTNRNCERRNPVSDPMHSSADHSVPDNVTWLSNIHQSCEETTSRMRQRYSVFRDDLEDFFMTLKLIKPINMESFQCLGDVISCHVYLREREVIGNNVRSDLVLAYLRLVNVLRLTADDTERQLISLQGHHHDDVTLGSIIDTCSELRLCFEPSFQFADMDDTTEYSLSVMNRQLFSGLVHYVPWLTGRIEKLNEHIKSYTCINNPV